MVHKSHRGWFKKTERRSSKSDTELEDFLDGGRHYKERQRKLAEQQNRPGTVLTQDKPHER